MPLFVKSFVYLGYPSDQPLLEFEKNEMCVRVAVGLEGMDVDLEGMAVDLEGMAVGLEGVAVGLEGVAGGI